VLLSGVQGITDLITTPGLINLDFADVKAIMSGAGSALMGIGRARGDDRAAAAAEAAISSPLLEASIDGAHGVLLNISGGSDLGLFEIHEAADLIAQAAHPDANIIFGAVIDDALGDEVRVTVIAAGFDGGEPKQRREPAIIRRPAEARQPAVVNVVDEDIDLDDVDEDDPVPAFARARTEPEPVRVAPRVEQPRRKIVFEDTDDLDVPDFLK
jgi:cell division protein FtsZ